MNTKNITLRSVLAWILGIIFLLWGVALLFSNFFNGIVFVACAALTLPNVNKLLKDKTGIVLSAGLRFILIIVLLGIALGVSSAEVNNTPVAVSTTQTSVAVTSTPTQKSGSIPKKAVVENPTPVQNVVVSNPQPVAATPAPAPTPIVVPASFTISGVGQTASRQFTLQQGLVVFTMHYSGSGNFIVELMDSNGNEVQNLANKIGDYNGSQAFQVPSTGSYLFNVQAGSAQSSGSWSITVNYPVPSNTSSVSTLSGNGDEATQFFYLSSGLHTFNLSYAGGGNFIVELLDSNGNQIENLENQIGNFNGSTAVGIDTAGPYLLNIQASSAETGGNWNVQIQ